MIPKPTFVYPGFSAADLFESHGRIPGARPGSAQPFPASTMDDLLNPQPAEARIPMQSDGTPPTSTMDDPFGWNKVKSGQTHDKPSGTAKTQANARPADDAPYVRSNGRVHFRRPIPARSSGVPPQILNMFRRLNWEVDLSSMESLEAAANTCAAYEFFARQIATETAYLSSQASFVDSPQNRQRLNALASSPEAIFDFQDGDLEPLKAVFRALAHRYHSDRNKFADTQPDIVLFGNLTQSWRLIKAHRDWK